MGPVSGIVVYLMVWWTLLFCVLPIGVKPHQEGGVGTAGSAPQNPNLKFKFLLTTVLSCMIWLMIYVLIEIEVIDFRNEANQMWAEDLGAQE